MERIPGLIATAHTKGDNIQGYYDAGIQSLSFNMEGWDPKYYETIGIRESLL